MGTMLDYYIVNFAFYFIIVSYIFFVVWLILHPEDRSHKFKKVHSDGIYDYFVEYNYGTIFKQFFFALLIVIPILSFFILYAVWLEREDFGREFSKGFLLSLKIYNGIWLVIFLLLFTNSC